MSDVEDNWVDPVRPGETCSRCGVRHRYQRTVDRCLARFRYLMSLRWARYCLTRAQHFEMSAAVYLRLAQGEAEWEVAKTYLWEAVCARTMWEQIEALRADPNPATLERVLSLPDADVRAMQTEIASMAFAGVVEEVERHRALNEELTALLGDESGGAT